MTRFLFIFTLLFCTAASADPALSRYEAFNGRIFSSPGPNCFSTSFRMQGLSRSFRGVDEKEFSAAVDLFCRPVTEPRQGDIGVFETPGFGFIHAFIYLTPELGIQKPGVDTMHGATAIRFYGLENINYMFLASPECRRYAPDISVCSNVLRYVRCEPISMKGHPGAQRHDQIVADIEARMDVLLEVAKFGEPEQNLLLEIENLMILARHSLPVEEEIEPRLLRFLQARMMSLADQVKYFQLKK